MFKKLPILAVAAFALTGLSSVSFAGVPAGNGDSVEGSLYAQESTVMQNKKEMDMDKIEPAAGAHQQEHERNSNYNGD